jgi:hypothetical protein
MIGKVLSTIIYQDAGSGVPSAALATGNSTCNYDHQLSTVNNDGSIIANKLYSPWFLMP